MTLRLGSQKRPNYFTGQLLGQEDFLAEQKYHLGLQRGHLQNLHTWGVVMGLEVASSDKVSVVVRPGTALDAQGRLIVIDGAQNLQPSPSTPDAAVFVTVRYDEGFDDLDRSTDNTENFTRFSELCVLDETATMPSDDGITVALAKVQFAGGRISSIDEGIRRLAGARLAPESVGSQQIATGAITLAKLSAELRGRWVRSSFKPSSFVDPVQAGQAAEVARDFTIGVTKTYCGERGAKGTMSIPVPVLADRLVAFAIGGDSNEGQIDIELDLCGWNPVQNVHEKITVVKTQIPKSTPFYSSFAINKGFDRTRHALALYVAASGSASISVVAAQFDSATIS